MPQPDQDSLIPIPNLTGPKKPRGHRRFSEPQILRWADAFHKQHRKWPSILSGTIPDADGATWRAVDDALRHGLNGMDICHNGLPRFLYERRGAPLRGRARFKLTIPQILQWAKAHRARTGFWPSHHSGRLLAVPTQSWRAIDDALRAGLRGLPANLTLSQLLEERLGVPPNAERAVRFDLDEKTVIRWARAFRGKNGKWPSQLAGVIEAPEAEGRTWGLIDQALSKGYYGLPGGTSLHRLLSREQGVLPRNQRPPLTEDRIILWAKAHQQARGKLPTENSGAALTEKSLPTGTTWRGIEAALRDGKRGLPGGDTLARLFRRRLGASASRVAPRLDDETLVRWMKNWKDRTGKWPSDDSGTIPEAPDENWGAVIASLRAGCRGLKGKRNAVRFRAQHGLE